MQPQPIDNRLSLPFPLYCFHHASMIDPKSVVTQVKQGNYPSDWRVYRSQGNYGCAIACWIGALFAIGLGLLCLAAWPSGPTAGIFVLCIISCVGVALVYTSKAASNDQAILVILPEGVVQYDANDPENIGWLYYPTIDGMELAQQTEVVGFDGDINSRTYYWLDIYGSEGAYLKWGIISCFGDTASICKTIIAAYNYYWRQNSFYHL
jgi:hypothetical protein